MTAARVVVIVGTATALVLTGCSAGTSPAPSPSPSPTRPAGIIDALAKKAGCVGWLRETSDLQKYAVAQGSCTVGGVDLTISLFANGQQRDKFVTASKGLGGSIAKGDLWVVAGADAATVQAVGKLLG
jgi:hypothetical protein